MRIKNKLTIWAPLFLIGLKYLIKSLLGIISKLHNHNKYLRIHNVIRIWEEHVLGTHTQKSLDFFFSGWNVTWTCFVILVVLQPCGVEYSKIHRQSRIYWRSINAECLSFCVQSWWGCTTSVAIQQLIRTDWLTAFQLIRENSVPEHFVWIIAVAPFKHNDRKRPFLKSDMLRERWYKRMSSNKFNQKWRSDTSLHTLCDCIITAGCHTLVLSALSKSRYKKHELKLDCIVVCWQAFIGTNLDSKTNYSLSTYFRNSENKVTPVHICTWTKRKWQERQQMMTKKTVLKGTVPSKIQLNRCDHLWPLSLFNRKIKSIWI